LACVFVGGLFAQLVCVGVCVYFVDVCNQNRSTPRCPPPIAKALNTRTQTNQPTNKQSHQCTHDNCIILQQTAHEHASQTKTQTNKHPYKTKQNNNKQTTRKHKTTHTYKHQQSQTNKPEDFDLFVVVASCSWSYTITTTSHLRLFVRWW